MSFHAIDQFASPNRHAFVNGHSITFRDADDNAPRYVRGVSKETLRLFQEYHDATMPEVERRLNTTLVPIGRCTPLDGPREKHDLRFVTGVTEFYFS